MPTTQYRTYSEEDMMHNINVAKRILLDQLKRDGYLQPKVANRLDREWVFIIRKPSWISSMWRRFKKTADDDMLILTRTVNLRHDPIQVAMQTADDRPRSANLPQDGGDAGTDDDKGVE